MSQELARVEQPEGAGIVKGNAISPVDIIRELTTKGGVTAENVAAVEKLVAMQERQQEREARQRFAEAFARVRAKTKTINATKAIPGKGDSVRWYYAPLEDLQDEVEPILRSEGLELRFDSRREGPQANIVIGICIIMDPLTGYAERAECGVNAANCEGGDLGATKKAKRGALIEFLALKTRTDSDARFLGDLVSAEMAAELKRRVRAVGADEARFLKFAGADDYPRIRQGRLGELHSFLAAKEAKQSMSKAAGKAAEPAKREEVDPATGEVIPANLYPDDQRPKK